MISAQCEVSMHFQYNIERITNIHFTLTFIDQMTLSDRTPLSKGGVRGTMRWTAG